MTTLAANKPRAYEFGSRNALLMIAADIIYEGAAVGVVPASGHARPLAAGDVFAGFAEAKADNASGAAAAIRVELVESGKIELPVTGLVITDIGLPVYASDDDTFSLSPVGGVFIGIVHRFVSAGYGIVHFDAPVLVDPYGGFVHELKSANYTVDAEDAGKWIWVDTDAVVITLPAVEGIGGLRIGNIAAYGVSGVAISPAAADMIEGPDITAADNKDLINTKATARRGDFVEIGYGDANGWSVTRKRGTWAREA
ncbi:hypothetical protein C3941_23850 [Kaistia algarum]|uniref:hypothetical protein n=1 Tax=Kaistia algarum TaxID=2083279 RepID=UPI000CE7A580|nr:hypothetical protein [Kaistia algarum]MCX5513427.1 hypothetical protein [Kaistia algarum]PPE77433.1 hypothetical protein C3941_23850 [Kaistia algarum]